MKDMSGWHPADQASRDTLLYLRKWQRRDLYFYGTMTLFWAGLAGWYVWLAMEGPWWRWVTVGIYTGFVAWYGYCTRRAFHRWQVCDQILSESPNQD